MKINNLIKNFFKRIIPQVAWSKFKELYSIKAINKWKNSGCPLPPPHIVKQKTIWEYQKKYNYTTFVETGTFIGTMVEAQKTRFKKIISIELGDDLYIKAKKRFEKDKHIMIVHGDSSKILPKILKELREPIIFWLDGHYSGGITVKGDKECPIFDELDAIFESKQSNHIILIDDARCFVGEGDYPTIEELTKYVLSKNNNYEVVVKNDIIRCEING